MNKEKKNKFKKMVISIVSIKEIMITKLKWQ